MLDGREVRGVTTVLGGGVPKPALVGWAANTVAAAAVDRWAELAELTPSKRLEALKRARFEDRDQAANRGREVHTLAEKLAAGGEVEVPEPLIGHVDAYLEFLAAYSVVEVAVEATVLHRGGGGVLPYMGTLDLLAHLDGSDGLTLVDWKTGRSGVFAESALQLAAYAHAQALLAPDGSESPMPAIERALAVWLRADGYDVIPLEVGPEVFRVFCYAQQLDRFTEGREPQVLGEALPARQLEPEAAE